MGYKEEIFERLERDNFEDVSEIIDWLAGDKYDPRTGKVQKKSRSRSSYQDFAEELAEPFKLKNSIEEADSIKEIEKLQKDVGKIGISNARKELDKLIDNRRKEFQELERDVQEVKLEIDSVATDINKEEVAEKELIRYELDLQKEQEIYQIPDAYSDSERIRAELEINKNLESIEKERVKEIERANYEKIKDLLQRKQEFEEIIRTTKDRRKRENAKRNITKITRRMK